MSELIGLGITVGMLLVTFLIGRAVERAHFRSILRREEKGKELPVTNLRQLPAGHRPVESRLCLGHVVIASDYFKSFAAGLKKLIGGRLRTFETLLERARREALLRMKQKALEMGADIVLNVRVETATLGRAAGNKGLSMVEIVAFGTAVRFRPGSSSAPPSP